MAATLSTRRIVLTPCATGDFDDIVALHRDPRVIAFLIDGLPDDARKAAIYLDWAAALHARGIGPWTARRRSDGVFLGLFTLTPYVDGDDALLELGGRLARAGWAGELAVEAGAALIDHAFGDLGRTALVSLHHPDNPTVPTILGRFGFDGGEPATLYGQPATLHRLAAETWRAQGGRPLARQRTLSSRSDYRGHASLPVPVTD